MCCKKKWNSTSPLCPFSLKKKKKIFIYLCLAILVLCCCVGFSLVAMSVGHSLVVGCRLPSPQGTGSRVHGLQYWQHVGSVVADPGLWSTGSTVVAPGLHYSTACSISPFQGLNPHLLHWQVDSWALSHQESPHLPFLIKRIPMLI